MAHPLHALAEERTQRIAKLARNRRSRWPDPEAAATAAETETGDDTSGDITGFPGLPPEYCQAVGELLQHEIDHLDGVLSVASIIGFITLFGIATRNGVMMVAHIQNLAGQFTINGSDHHGTLCTCRGTIND